MPAYAGTQEIDDMLDSLAREMPSSVSLIDPIFEAFIDVTKLVVGSPRHKRRECQYAVRVRRLRPFDDSDLVLPDPRSRTSPIHAESLYRASLRVQQV